MKLSNEELKQQMDLVSSYVGDMRLGVTILIYSMGKEGNLEKAYNLIKANPKISAKDYLVKMNLVEIYRDSLLDDNSAKIYDLSKD